MRKVSLLRLEEKNKQTQRMQQEVSDLNQDYEKGKTQTLKFELTKHIL